MSEKHMFKNGYGASIIAPCQFTFSCWEVAVLIQTSDELFELCYTPPLTNDVERFLTREEADEFVAKIEKLPPTYPTTISDITPSSPLVKPNATT